ncbi:SMR family transporter [Falsirhodobacter deserti]|uniref:SMR family transporter n=1 Tax=Falsirhodobacter deserti TaxID=1365611 RepID=UPI000FE40DD8|nr:SMR family transporter [Falsirhodobacter deserti]
MLNTYLALIAAVAFEVAGTTLLHMSQQFTRFWPTLSMALCYLAAFWLLSITLRVLPIGLAYAIWSGTGIVLISAIGVVFLGQRLDAPAIIGIALIIAGVLVVNLFSKTAGH